MLQQSDDIFLGVGTEPTVTFNQANDPNDRVVVAFIGWSGGNNQTIKYRYSENAGIFGSWTDESELHSTANADPTLASNPTSGAYYAVWQSPVTEERYSFKKSLSNLNGFPAEHQVAEGLPAGRTYDRPWLIKSGSELLYTFIDANMGAGSPQTSLPRADRGTIESDGTITWSGAAAPVVPVEDELTLPRSFHFSNPPARTSGAEWIATIAMTNDVVNPSPPNEVRLYKRTTGDWSQDATFTVNLNSSTGCGYFVGRDRQMCDFHVVAEPGGDNVYVFYVRTEPVGVPDDGGQYAFRRQSLYVKRSLNGGTNWQTPVRVYTLPQADWPARWATVPGLAGHGGTSTQGFYRIGRVWSCISPDGTVHVVWFDNRAGYYGDGVVETQTVELDNWRVHRAVSLDEGATWSVRANVSDEESRGGVGTPKPLNQSYYAPQGEFLACDASNQWLWIVWPDSRKYADNIPGNDQPEIYLQRVVRSGW